MNSKAIFAFACVLLASGCAPSGNGGNPSDRDQIQSLLQRYVSAICKADYAGMAACVKGAAVNDQLKSALPNPLGATAKVTILDMAERPDGAKDVSFFIELNGKPEPKELLGVVKQGGAWIIGGTNSTTSTSRYVLIMQGTLH